jgi:phospholipid/cholesterol/gamma-HCH transport system substrate-binding protein
VRYPLNSEHKEIYIGAVTVALLVGVLGVMNQSQMLSSKVETTHKRIIAKFNKVDGLSEGSDVRMGGIRVGRVTNMDLDSKFRAVVTMSVDSQFPYTLDTSAAIHTDGLFGVKFIVLEPGAEEAVLSSGDEISLTQDAVVVGDLLELIISEGNVAKAKRRSAN